MIFVNVEELIRENAKLKEQGKNLSIQYLHDQLNFNSKLAMKDRIIAKLEKKLSVCIENNNAMLAALTEVTNKKAELEDLCAKYAEYTAELNKKKDILEEKASIVDEAIASIMEGK